MSNNEQITFFRTKLATDNNWATRGLVRIYQNQTPCEQSASITQEHNGIGFTGADAPILTSLAKQYQQRQWLSEKQMAIVFKKMPKYARQLFELADKTKLKKV